MKKIVFVASTAAVLLAAAVIVCFAVFHNPAGESGPAASGITAGESRPAASGITAEEETNASESAADDREPTGPMVIMTTPAEDASCAVNISWYDTRCNDELIYTTAEDVSFVNAETLSSVGEETGFEAFYEFATAHTEEFPQYAGRTLYRHTLTIEGLEPDTGYIYNVISGEKQSDVRSFRTAGSDGSFAFAWFADLHACPDEPGKLPIFNRLMENVENAASGQVGLVLFSGDLVKYGNMFTAWMQWDSADAVKEHLFAPIPGNKEYYRLTDYNEGSRTKYADKESEDSDLGTVYITYTELLDYLMDDEAMPGKDDRMAAYIKESINAGGLFEVTPETITFSLIDYEGNIADSTVVAKKNR